MRKVTTLFPPVWSVVIAVAVGLATTLGAQGGGAGGGPGHGGGIPDPTPTATDGIAFPSHLYNFSQPNGVPDASAELLEGGGPKVFGPCTHDPSVIDDPVWSLSGAPGLPPWAAISQDGIITTNPPLNSNLGSVPSYSQSLFLRLGDNDNDPSGQDQHVVYVKVWSNIRFLEPNDAYLGSIPFTGFVDELVKSKHGFRRGNPEFGVEFAIEQYLDRPIPAWLSIVAPLDDDPGTPEDERGIARLSGTPMTPDDVGTFYFWIRVTDTGWTSINPGGNATSATRYFQITVEEPLALAFTTPEGSLGLAYTGQPFAASVQAAGGFPTLQYSCSNLPDWLTLDPDTGALSGTPTVEQGVGTLTLQITAEDGSPNPQVVTGEFTIEIGVLETLEIITGTNLPAARIGEAYALQLMAVGGAGEYTWTVNGLPEGVAYSATGAISGTPLPGTDTAHHVTISVHDEIQNSDSSQHVLVVYPPDVPLITITTSSLPPGTAGESYGPVTLQASGGSEAYIWQCEGLPAGLALDGNVITGMPEQEGLHYVRVTVTSGASEAENLYPLVILSAEAEQIPEATSAPPVSAEQLLAGAAAGACAVRSGMSMDHTTSLIWGALVMTLLAASGRRRMR